MSARKKYQRFRKVVTAAATGKAKVEADGRSTFVVLTVAVDGIRGDRTLRLYPAEARALGVDILTAAEFRRRFGIAAADVAADELDGLKAERDRLHEALLALLPVFEGECYFDHNGDCQQHHAGKIHGQCAAAYAAALMADVVDLDP